MTGTLTVTKAPLVITASNASMVYGGAAPTVTPSYSGFVNGQGPSVLATAPTCGGGSPTTPAGTHATTCSGAAAANYEISYVDGVLTVDKAVLNVTADNKTKGYGDPVPSPLTYSVSGFVNGEGSSVLSGAPALSTTATPTSNVGTYPITITMGTLAAGNYRFTFTNGTLTVTRAATTLVAAPAIIRVLPLEVHLGIVSARLTFGPSGTPAVGQAHRVHRREDRALLGHHRCDWDGQVLRDAARCGGGHRQPRVQGDLQRERQPVAEHRERPPDQVTPSAPLSRRRRLAAPRRAAGRRSPRARAGDRGRAAPPR